MTTQFFCPYLDSEVELTEEREQHIAETHPDLLPTYQERIAETLADPDEVRCDLRFGNTFLFSRQYGKGRKGRYVVVAVVSDTVPRERNWIVTAYLTKTVTQGEIMAQKLTFKYDAVGDILYINKCSPYAEQESQELDYGIVARLNPETEEIENIEVMFFSKRFLESNVFELPIVADLHLSLQA